MKKKIIIAFFVFVGISQSHAQVSIKPGVKAGVDFARLTNFDSDFNTGFYLGGQLSIKFNKVYTLQPELVYAQQGASRSYDLLYDYNPYNPDPVFFASPKTNYSIDYLSLSAINKFYFDGGFHLVVGPSLDFKVNDNFNQQGYYYDDVIGFDFAIIGGVGYSFSNGLSFDARFKQGMIDIYGFDRGLSIDSNNNGNYDEVVLNQSFQLGISYIFDLK
jgi:hypothetical protein